ncbi:dipeptidase [Shimazuella alba]|uniref:Membrane dipeptidase n=1 Tax=Shimazuella alba TaxID=2690964 RepID=A0A6I4VQX2_9BACL|nr:dipeptidase [Shimazuella alba]MXQ52306.1 membrane dipeptidase [Shimazuella alba]
MYWIDSHCDVLYQLWKRERNNHFFSNKYQNVNLFLITDSPLDVSYRALKQNNVLLQNFAIFVPDNIPQTAKLDVALKQIDLFYQQVEPYVPLVRRHMELDAVLDGHLLSILTLEGGEAIGKDISLLRTFYRLGVRQVGLTWNGVNALADGCKEKRNGGLTEFGRKCVKEMIRLGMIIDVSHLSEQGFWDVVSIPQVKVIASHSNCKKHCMHPRNLTDEQIQAIISLNGLIGVTYVPQFVFQPYQEARMEHLLHHLNHIQYLGGEDHIAFGSDFDGMENKLEGLSNAFDISNFYELLRYHYPEKIVHKWTYENAYHFYKNSLR